MTIDVATGIARILKQEGVDWVSTFPVCRVNNALGREGVPLLLMRDDRYAVAVADATGTYDETADPYLPVKGAKSAPDPADVRAAVTLLLQAQNPLLYAAAGRPAYLECLCCQYPVYGQWVGRSRE
jgi:thiamine pyrophosphate-dependent acetolactate synthase large subunit-like protein